jgi:hypothetical protein
MKGQLIEAETDIELTVELPVLTEEDVLRFRAEEESIQAENSLEVSVGELRRTTSEPELTSPRTDDALTDALPGAASGLEENALLERIGSLENHIGSLAERWRDMEEELLKKALRISELEYELEQRIEREQHLEDRLYEEGDRLRLLRVKLHSMERDAGAGASEAAKHAELVCLNPELSERYAITKPEIRIGRSRECDVRIPAECVSEVHATLQCRETEFVIKDQASTNGVFVNAVRVNSKTLADGDEITIGETQFRYLAPNTGG